MLRFQILCEQLAELGWRKKRDGVIEQKEDGLVAASRGSPCEFVADRICRRASSPRVIGLHFINDHPIAGDAMYTGMRNRSFRHPCLSIALCMAQARIASRLVNCLFPTKVISADAEETRSATPASHDLFFTKELAGEEPPSFAAMKRLYGRASDLFGFRPWHILSESELVVTCDSKSGEPWYCSVMGSMGEVYSMQAYRGEEGFAPFSLDRG